jgi:hypothetical protein
MVEKTLAAQGIVVGDETFRRRAEKFCREFSNGIARRAPVRGDKWYREEGVVAFAGNKRWLWRAVDQVAKLYHIPRREKMPAPDCRPFATRPCGLDPDRARPARRLPAPISGNQPRRAGGRST